jgi:hypothetical protein
MIKKADSFLQIPSLNSHMPQQISPSNRKNNSSMTIKIFMSNVSEKVKSKISNPAKEKDK